jgi:hypothetical protein
LYEGLRILVFLVRPQQHWKLQDDGAISSKFQKRTKLNSKENKDILGRKHNCSTTCDLAVSHCLSHAVGSKYCTLQILQPNLLGG